MLAPALLNVIRCNSSYLTEAEVVRLLSSELSSLPVATLKELARILALPSTGRKAELVIDIRTFIDHLAIQPLTYDALRREAERGDQYSASFTYRDLRVLCGYETITSAGLYYLRTEAPTVLNTILLVTKSGSRQRLARLKQQMQAVSDWDTSILVNTSDPAVYRLLYSKVVILNEYNRHTRLLFTDTHDELGTILLTTMPKSADRHRLLRAYDPILVASFQRAHELPAEQDLGETLALNSYQLDDDADRVYHYTTDDDPLTRALAATREKTLERYVAVLGLDPAVEEMCVVPRLEDERPHMLRDYEPSEWEDLDLPVLQALAVREGLYSYGSEPPLNRSRLTDELEIAYVSPTFLRTDRIENTVQTQTCLLTALSEVRSGQLYAYRIRDGTDSSTYYERDELAGKFQAERDFIDPMSNRPFELTAIRRLYILTLNDHTEGAEAFRALLRELLLLISNISAEEKALARLLAPEPAVKNALLLLFEASLYMRRWDGDHTAYPLAVEATRIEVAEEVLSERVHVSLIRFQEAVDALPIGIASLFWQLPLKNFRRAGYYSAMEESDGITIRDRFHIVRQGNSADAPITSCFRLTSGWFLFTAIYYHNLFYRSTLNNVQPHSVAFIS